MRLLVLVLKGMAYGITHIAPGLGGGLVLILLGIYEEFVETVGNLLILPRRWKKHLAFLLPLGVGMVIGMVILAKLITVAWEAYPAATMFFFMGLLVGTIPSVLRIHDDMRLTVGRSVSLLFGVLLVVVVSGLGSAILGPRSLERLSTPGGTLYNLAVSFLAGGASVTPGLDGSYILLLGGTYAAIVEAVSELMHMTVHWGPLASTGLGAILGILMFSKLIDIAMKRVPAVSYYCILGLIVGSVYGLWPQEPARLGVGFLIVAFIVGLILALLLGKSPKEQDESGPNQTA